MLNSPVLRLETPPQETLVTRPNLAVSDFDRPNFSDWHLTNLPWAANDPKPEIAVIARAAKVLLAQYATLLRPPIRAGLLAQTDVIFDEEDWLDEDPLPSLDSYRNLLKGLIELNPNSRPNLSVSDHGHLIAGWFSDEERSIFEFFPNARIAWVITRKTNDETNRSTGVEPIKKIRAIAHAHDAYLGEVG